jgi:hypothetical protein
MLSSPVTLSLYIERLESVLRQGPVAALELAADDILFEFLGEPGTSSVAGRLAGKATVTTALSAINDSVIVEHFVIKSAIRDSGRVALRWKVHLRARTNGLLHAFDGMTWIRLNESGLAAEMAHALDTTAFARALGGD